MNEKAVLTRGAAIGGRRRLLVGRRMITVGVVGVSLTGSILGVGVGPALAYTPAAPQGQAGQIATQLPVSIEGLSITRPGNGVEISFTANRPSVTVQISKMAPSLVGGSYLSSGQIVSLSGQLVSGAGSSAKRAFVFEAQGLDAATKYYGLISVPGDTPVQKVVEFTTRRRKVQATFTQIVIVKDGDAGILGKGEIRFSFRMTAQNVNDSSLWSSYLPETKYDDGDVVGISNGAHVAFVNSLGVDYSNLRTVHLQVQAHENDHQAWQNCPLEGNAAAFNASNSCWDSRYAELFVETPKINTGASQLVNFSMTSGGTDKLRFKVKGFIEVSYE